jgi:hypothetical protein
MTLQAIADKRGTDPEMTLMDLIAESQVYPAKDRERVESVIGRSMKEPDIAAFIACSPTATSAPMARLHSVITPAARAPLHACCESMCASRSC